MLYDKAELSKLEYNSSRSDLIIPEYGRHIHKLVEKAKTIENREERNAAARYIISVMGFFNPHLRDVPDFQHKLWDQLFIMASTDFDVDSPFGKHQPEVIKYNAGRLPYPQTYPKYRFYGNNILNMIKVAVSWEDSELKTALIFSIANHMKKCFLNWNKDTVDDQVIYAHLKELSKGKIDMNQMGEELAATNNLMRVNKKMSNKLQTTPGNTPFTQKNKKPYTSNSNTTSSTNTQNRPRQNNNNTNTNTNTNNSNKK